MEATVHLASDLFVFSYIHVNSTFLNNIYCFRIKECTVLAISIMSIFQTRRDFLEKWGLSGLKINLGFLQGEFKPNDPDRAAAWELYIELLTRVTTQYLAPEDGDEKTALDSVHNIFGSMKN